MLIILNPAGDEFEYLFDTTSSTVMYNTTNNTLHVDCVNGRSYSAGLSQEDWNTFKQNANSLNNATLVVNVDTSVTESGVL